MATSATQYGITWSWSEDLTVGQFANGDYYVVAPSGLTLTGISPATAVVDGRQAHGSMINPTPGYYTSQGLDASLANYSSSLNIALVGGSPLSGGNTRSVAAGSSICSVISSPEGDRGVVREAFTDFAVLTVLASAPSAGSFRPPYTGTDKTAYWNVSDLDYSILRRLAGVTGLNSQPTSGAFTRPWVEIETDYNQARSWHPTNNQPEYDRDMGAAVSAAMLALHLDYSDAQKETAYVRLVQYGIDIYSMVKRGSYSGGHPAYSHNSQTKPVLVLAALALDHEDMKSYCDGEDFISNPFAWYGGEMPRFYVDVQHWYINSSDVARTVANGGLNSGMTPFTSEMIGTPEWGQEHWADPRKDNSLWEEPSGYRRTRYIGQVGTALAAHLTIGAVSLWNHPAFFDYMDRAFDLYTNGVDDPTPEYIKLFWIAYRDIEEPSDPGAGKRIGGFMLTPIS